MLSIIEILKNILSIDPTINDVNKDNKVFRNIVKS